MLSRLTRASLLSCTASSPSHLVRASCNLARSANPCEFTFLQPPQVRRANSLVPLATLEGLLTRASLLSCTASSPSHLARASCNLVGSANPWEFTFLYRNFAEQPRSCLLQPCRVCYTVRVYFTTQQDRRATSLVPLATLAGLLTRASLLSCTASSPSHLARASCNLVGSANPWEFTFLYRNFAEQPRSCLLQPCRVCYTVRVYFTTQQDRRATSLVPLATLAGLLTRASLLSCTASSPSHLARASCNLVGSANPWEFTFLYRNFAEQPRSCLLQPCRVCYTVRVYFTTQQDRRATSLVPLATLAAPQVRRANSLVPLATLEGLLNRASLLSCTASSPSHLARPSCNLAGSANLCEFTFLHRKFARPPRSCLLQPCWQVRRATSLVPLATLAGLLTRASLLSCTASSPSHLARVSCNLGGSANPCELTFQHRKFAEPPRSCLMQPCRVC
ncbi:hypothetical protein CRG98_027342 [Punica granatum]|uniref:Uncharacterized protein n=1 Tax=Punica granatum TaxID=22663 RepID=A0A2I0J994_PUNGR|nr:hypothetical protein CRG98_027342 [Punica granatum]